MRLSLLLPALLGLAACGDGPVVKPHLPLRPVVEATPTAVNPLPKVVVNKTPT